MATDPEGSSSIWQSTGLQNRRLGVQVPPALLKASYGKVTDVSTSEYNREQKRLLQRQGTLDAEGLPALRSGERRPPTGPSTRGGFHPRQFVDEVILELRKVMKPKRPELINYATVVFFTLAFIMALVYAIDYVYSLGSTQLFK